jgi:aspartate 1-decarboxylase
MILTLMKAKLHRATVTQCDINYEGSISIDAALLDAAGILPNEQVDVLDIANGERFTTYAIAAPAGSGMIGINGAAARLCQIGDLVIIVAFAQMSEAEARAHTPTVLQLDAANRPK